MMMNARRWNGMVLSGMVGVFGVSGAVFAQGEVVEKRTESRQNIVVERTGVPRVELEVEDGEIVVLVDGEVRERVEASRDWRGTEIKDEDGKLIVEIVRDPETGFFSMRTPTMHARTVELRGDRVYLHDGVWRPGKPQAHTEQHYIELPRGTVFTHMDQFNWSTTNSKWMPEAQYYLYNAAPGMSVMMGITMQPVEGALAHHLGLEPNRSTLVTSVMAESPAEEAGVMVHDIIMRIDGAEDSGLEAIREVLRGKSAGDEVALVVRRAGGNEKSLTVRVEKMERLLGTRLQTPAAPAVPAVPGLSSRGGVVEEEEVEIELDGRIEELRSHVEDLRIEIERRQREVRGEMRPEERVEALAGLRERIVELDASQTEMTRLRNEQIREQLGQLREQAVDLDLAMPQMLMEMMLEEEGRPGGRRMVFGLPSQQRAIGDEGAMQMLVEELRVAAESERARLAEELETSRARERELSARLERMERQLESLMQAMEQMVSTRADGVKPGEGMPE